MLDGTKFEQLLDERQLFVGREEIGELHEPRPAVTLVGHVPNDLERPVDPTHLGQGAQPLCPRCGLPLLARPREHLPYHEITTALVEVLREPTPALRDCIHHPVGQFAQSSGGQHQIETCPDRLLAGRHQAVERRGQPPLFAGAASEAHGIEHCASTVLTRALLPELRQHSDSVVNTVDRHRDGTRLFEQVIPGAPVQEVHDSPHRVEERERATQISQHHRCIPTKFIAKLRSVALGRCDGE